jgi:hypothetical protein
MRLKSLLNGRLLRPALYAGFLGVCLFLTIRDGLFPGAFDGVVYYVKAAWMADAPLERAVSWQAFAFEPTRPPGPMWLTLPFLTVWPDFHVFAGAMYFWVAVFVELAVRGLFPAHRRGSRNAAAVVLLLGPAVFYYDESAHNVDHLYMACAAAALGSACGWLRSGRWRSAWGAALLPALALMIKPAALALMAVVISGLAAALVVGKILEPKRQWKRRTLAQWAVVCLGAALGLAGLFLTPYRAAWEEYLPSRQLQSFWRAEYLEAWYRLEARPFSMEGLSAMTQTLCEILGPPLLVFLLVGAVAGNCARRCRGSWRRQAPFLVFWMAAVGGFLLFTWRLPIKPARYVGPLAMVLTAACLALVAGTGRRGRRLLWATALVTLCWRGAFLMGCEWRKPWWNVERRWPMNEARNNLRLMEEAARSQFPGRDKLVYYGFNSSWELAGIYLVAYADQMGLPHVRQRLGLGTESERALHGPGGPDFPFTSLPEYLEADFLVVPPFKPEGTYPEESRREDQRRLDMTLARGAWDATGRPSGTESNSAKQYGWKRLAQGDLAVVYVSDPEARLPLAALRARLLADAELQSPDGREWTRRWATLARLEGLEPARREFVRQEFPEGCTGFLLHAPYPDNPLPESATLCARPDDRLVATVRGDGNGDGVVLLIEMEPNEREHQSIQIPLAPGTKWTAPIQSLFPEMPEGPALIRTNVQAGTAGNPDYDQVTLGLIPGEK